MAVLMTPPKAQFFDSNGDPLNGGKIYFYSAGTTTPKDTYTTYTGGVANANPVVLDSAGRADIWLSTSGSYKIVVKDSADNTISTTDNISAYTASSTGTFSDTVFTVQDNADATKQLMFQLENISTGTTRTITWPDANLEVVGTSTTQSLTNKTIGGGSVVAASILYGIERTIASASTITLQSTSAPYVVITGTTGISSFGDTTATGQLQYVRFSAALTLTHSSSLILPTSANITTAAGDMLIAKPEGSNVWRVVAYFRADGSCLRLNASSQSTPADPTGTSDTTGKMMGLAGSFTPTNTGKVAIFISGSMIQNTNTDGGKVQIRYGTGSAPANADALTGTAVGNIVSLNMTTAASARLGWACHAIVTGLTPGTAYWIDTGLAAVTGGTASIKDVSISAHEF